MTDVRETCFTCLSDEDYCSIWTNETWCKNKIESWVKDFPDQCKDFRIIEDAMSVKIPKHCMKYITIRRARPEMDEETRQKKVDIMRKAREARKGK